MPPQQAIPGPRGYPLVGAFPRARRDPLGFFLEANRRYGDIVALPLRPRRLYLLCHPDHIKDVLQDHARAFRKSVAAEPIRPLFGESLTTVDGDEWARRRRMMRPAFAPPRMEALVPLIVRATGAMLEGWRGAAERGRPLDIFGEMTELTRTIILRTLFGDVASEDARAVGHAIAFVAERVNQSLWSPLGWLSRFAPTRRDYGHALSVLDEFMAHRIEEGRRRRPGDDVLSALLAA